MSSERHTIHSGHRHYGWDNSFPPVETVAPGTTLRFECFDAGNGHFGPGSTAADVATLDFTKVNPVTGPVFIDGAEPGDALKVTIGDFEPSGTGWTANIPGFGLLADQFPEPALHLWSYDPGRRGAGALRPRRARADQALRRHHRRSPRPSRGCTRWCRRGGSAATWTSATSTGARCSTCRSRSPGALFSVGDTHAAQGDGEVCGTAIESAMAVTLTFDLVKGANLAFPRFEAPRARRPGTSTARATTSPPASAPT